MFSFTYLGIFLTIFTICSGFKNKEIFYPNGRIIGGNFAKIGELPYQVLIKQRGFVHCGGALINNITVITAAHCVTSISNSQLRIVAGSIYSFMGGIEKKISEIIIHPNYSNINQNNDIAIIKLNDNINFNNNIKIINLPNISEELTPNIWGRVSGWGSLREGGFSSSILQYVDVQIIDNKECAISYKGKATITNNMICAGFKEGGKDSCQGDSGGPLVIDGTIYGIVSFGSGCGRPLYPGVYTKISVYRSWIDEFL